MRAGYVEAMVIPNPWIEPCRRYLDLIGELHAPPTAPCWDPALIISTAEHYVMQWISVWRKEDFIHHFIQVIKLSRIFWGSQRDGASSACLMKGFTFLHQCVHGLIPQVSAVPLAP